MAEPPHRGGLAPGSANGSNATRTGPKLSVGRGTTRAEPEGDLVWFRFLLRWCREAKAAAQGPAAVAPPDHEPRGRPDAPPGLARRLRPDPPGCGGGGSAGTAVGGAARPCL